MPTNSSPNAPEGSLERAKVLSVRLTYDEFDQLSAQAKAIGVGPSTLARTLIRRGLTTPTIDFVNPVDPAVTVEWQPTTVEARLLQTLDERVGALEAQVAKHRA